MTTKEFEKRFSNKLADYAKNFDLESLNDANDKTLLTIMIKTELMIEDLQEQIQEKVVSGGLDDATEIKKLFDLLRDATNTVSTLQKTLGIDRKSRKTEQSDSVAEYIRTLKSMAADFMERRLVKIYCPNCQIMVARFSAVHEHTAFAVQIQCNQCNKTVRARRSERDIWFDVKDSDWRKKYPAEIVHPKRRKTKSSITDFDAIEAAPDDVVLFANNETSIVPDDALETPSLEISPNLDIGEEYGITEED